MSTIDRMQEALDGLERRWKGKRRPKAFYLGPDDWADFMATNPPVNRFPFGNNPPRFVEDPTFKGVPVRASKNVPPRRSKLYDHTTSATALKE